MICLKSDWLNQKKSDKKMIIVSMCVAIGWGSSNV